MASERRAQVVRLAEILGVEFERSIGTAELMEMCVTEADCRLGSGEGHPVEGDEVEEAEGAEERETTSDEPPAGMRPALRSLPAPESSRARHHAGGNGARKRRQSREVFEAEQRVIAEMREVERPSEAEGAEGVEPALEATRRGGRVQRRAS